MTAQGHRAVSEDYKRRFLAETDLNRRSMWRRFQMKHVLLASALERQERGVTALGDRDRAEWKPPCLKGCAVNCGRCA